MNQYFKPLVIGLMMIVGLSGLREKLMSIKQDNESKESREPDYGDKDELEEKQEEETGEVSKQETTNQVF